MRNRNWNDASGWAAEWCVTRKGVGTGGGGGKQWAMAPSLLYKEGPSVTLAPKNEDENCCTAYNMDKKNPHHSKNVAQTPLGELTALPQTL